MTITVAPARNEYTANAGQTIFNYTFKIFQNTDLNVYVTPAGQDANDSTDLTTLYTVSGIGDEDGGSITLAIPTNANDLVTIVSAIPSRRTTDYQFNGDFIPKVVNSDFDRVVSLVKKVEDRTNRALLLPESQQDPKPLRLPIPKAGFAVRWNSDASGLENYDNRTVSNEEIASDKVVINYNSITECINDPSLKINQACNIAGRNVKSDGGGAIWDCVLTSSVITNGIDIIQSIEVPELSLKYRKNEIVNGLALGAFPNPVATVSEDVSQNILRASEIAGKEAVLLKAGSYNTGTADFTGLNYISIGNARSYQTTTLRATDLSQADNDSPLGHSVIDMHYTILRGTGARTGEAQSGGFAGNSDLSFQVSLPVLKGSKTISLVDASPLIAGQLIAYGGNDGQFYTAKIKNITSNNLTVAEPVESGVNAGENVFAYYRNDYHPSDTGYKAIADHAIRELRTKRTIVSRSNLEVRGSGTLTPITVNDQSNPGSYRPATPEAEVLSVSVVSPGTSPSANGAQAQFNTKIAGQYEIHVVVNTEGEDVVINWVGSGGFSRSITVNNDSPTLYRAPAFVYGDSGSLVVTLGTEADGGTFKAKSSVHLVLVENRQFNLNRGTHVAMGDSWFAEGPLLDRLRERLPNATIFNKGVGGEKAADINSRFQSDAVPLEPDFVWFMSGTNDWFGFVNPELFSYQLGQFKASCNSIGATCLMFTGSVAPDANLANQWSWSRAYLERSYYENELLPEKTEPLTRVVNVPAGTPVQLGRYSSSNQLVILEHYLNSSCDIIESSSLVGNDNSTVIPSGFVGNAGITISPSVSKFIRVESASAGYLIIKELPII